MIYKDLRGFIKQVEDLDALRRVDGRGPAFRTGGITEVAAGTPECPALLFDKYQGSSEAPAFASSPMPPPRRGAPPSRSALTRTSAARRAQGVDGKAAKR